MNKRLKIITLIGIIAGIITIFSFVTGIFTINPRKQETPDIVYTDGAAYGAPENEKEIDAKWDISSSSHLIATPSEYNYDYSAISAYDGDPETSWIPGPPTLAEKTTAKGRAIRYGIGEYLEFDLKEGKEAIINSISIVNGAWKSVTGNEDIYDDNNRAKVIKIVFDNDYSEIFELSEQDYRHIDYQKIDFDTPISASCIRIEFLAVYEGTDVSGNNDLMISEVKIDATTIIE